MIPSHSHIQVSQSSSVYAARFAKAFHTAGLGPRAGEIAHFRAMSASMVAASTVDVRVASHEYHGARHQVRFQGRGGYSRPSARCELSDLAVLAYNPKRREGRLTYIQAKYERLRGACCVSPPKSLAANLEQWDLLGRRPKLTSGVGNFSPPLDLLSGAARDSVGTFVFFVECGCGHVDMVYSVARDLVPTGSTPRRYGRVATPGPYCRLRPPAELRSAWGAGAVAAGLADLRIGTPILNGSTKVSGLDAWLSTQLAAAASQPNAEPDFVGLASELRALLGERDPEDSEEVPPGIGASQLLIMQTSSDRQESD